jgi:hypothetical protein
MLAPILNAAMISAPPTGDLGSVLFHSCQALIREADSATGTEQDRRSGQHCLSYVSGFIDGMSAGRIACFGNASKEAIIRSYINSVQTHPKLLDEDQGVGFYIVMLQAYPCPVKK